MAVTRPAEASVPILVRPVREQLEHDRVIRLLQAKYRRKFRQVDMNPGDERTGSLKVGTLTLFPDLVLWEDSPKKPYAVVEVETGESVNHLEAMSQWANFAKSKSYLYLYVPAMSVDAVKRLCTDHDIAPTELTSYLVVGDQIRFNTVSKVTTPEPVVSVRPPQDKPAKVEKPAEKPAEPAPVAIAPVKAAPPPAAKTAEKPVAPAAPQVTPKVAAKIATKAVAKVAEKAPEKVAKKVAVKAEPAVEPKAPPVKVAPKPAPKPVRMEKPAARPEKRTAAPVKPSAKGKTVTKAPAKPAARPVPAAKPRAAASRIAARPAAKRAPAVAKPRPKAVAVRASGKAAQKRK
jgi:hypothetical protein